MKGNGNQVKIVIIDDTITSKKVLEKTHEIYEITDTLDCKKLTVRCEDISFDSHSDICCKIIMKKINQVEFVNIVFREINQHGRVDKFVKALEVANKFETDIIHLSVGTNLPIMLFRMYRIVRKLTKKCIVVAATSNNGKVTFPAVFPRVRLCKASSLQEEKETKKIKMIYGEQIIRNNYGFFMSIPNDNSFAAAEYTGRIAQQIYMAYKNI